MQADRNSRKWKKMFHIFWTNSTTWATANISFKHPTEICMEVRFKEQKCIKRHPTLEFEFNVKKEKIDVLQEEVKDLNVKLSKVEAESLETKYVIETLLSDVENIN